MNSPAIAAGTLRLARGLVALALALPCAAQQAPGSTTPSPELQVNPLTALRDFEGPANEEYTLGRGDEISVDFPTRPELNAKRIVGPDGRITLAPAGSIAVADKTREQAAQVIAASLSPFYVNLSVTVGVDKYSSDYVLLLGAVDHPGMIPFDAPPTLLQVLTVGGGLSKGNNSNSVAGPNGINAQARVSAAVPERVAIYRGSEKVMWVDVKALIDSGSALADLRLRRGDTVYVPSPSERYVSVLGQVNHPGALQLDNNTTLSKLLAEAGGFTVQAGKNPNIQVISAATGKSRVIRLDAVLQPGPLDISLKSGDIVFVNESGFNQFTYAVERLSPLISIFTTAALLNQH